MKPNPPKFQPKSPQARVLQAEHDLKHRTEHLELVMRTLEDEHPEVYHAMPAGVLAWHKQVKEVK